MNKTKITLIIVVVALSAASAVYAQSFNPSFGTGNVLPFSNGPSASQERKVVVHQDGLHAFASAPTPSANRNDPVTTGGGSRGYNENLYNY